MTESTKKSKIVQLLFIATNILYIHTEQYHPHDIVMI